MVTRIRRAVLAMALTPLMATCLAGVAWAVNTSLPSRRQHQ